MLQCITFSLLFYILILAAPMETNAQQHNDPFGVTVAFTEGSSDDLSRFFGDKVEISLDNTKRDFSNNQAEVVLRDFFKKNPAEGFELIKERRSNDNIIYLIGLYRSINNVYRVLIKGNERKNQQVLIYSIDFIKE